MWKTVKKRWATYTKPQKAAVVSAGLTLAYAALVKTGIAPAEDSWQLVKEIVITFLVI